MTSAEAARLDDMALYVTRNVSRLMTRYEAQGVGRWLFCWPGLLAPQAWFLYRKMYLWAALVTAGPLVISYVPKLAYLDWGGSLLGAFGLRLYFAGAERAIARIRAETPDEETARGRIRRAGGVSRVGAAIGLAFAFSAFVLSLKAGVSAIPPLR